MTTDRRASSHAGPTVGPIRNLFIANRGEIAVRIIRAARSMGIDTVQAFSAADENMLACRLADRKVPIGPARAAESYLNAKSVLEAAIAAGCDAIHPGYGFLSENPDFAEMVEDAGITLVGPSPGTIRRMGDKAEARRCAQDAGVPVIPGSDGRVTPAQAMRLAGEIGFPLMIKAAAGGGGRGIRVVAEPSQLEDQLRQASAEAAAAFGDGGLYLERFLPSARHIEVQILGDGKDVIHLHERDCSIQRRRQKIWEEAPSSTLSGKTRESLFASAVRLGRAVAYRGAGTLEYLYEESTGQFYFIEMNTRIQVEHTVTECVTGIDIVQEMIRVASGQPLSLRQEDVVLQGHSIQCRLNAEDPHRNFIPSAGTISDLSIPGGPGVRFDGAIYRGYGVPVFYDSLLGKLIVWGSSRVAALARMRQALDETEIKGIKTNLPLHKALARDRDVELGAVDTTWLEHWLKANQAQMAG